MKIVLLLLAAFYAADLRADSVSETLDLVRDMNISVPDEAADTESVAESPEETAKCEDGTTPDDDGCCTGETFKETNDGYWNCCPDEGDCFPPIK